MDATVEDGALQHLTETPREQSTTSLRSTRTRKMTDYAYNKCRTLMTTYSPLSMNRATWTTRQTHDMATTTSIR
eukprot:1940665-Amphidinium_carterae.1